VALLALSITLFIFYVSSRPITGAVPLTDWRLIIPVALFFAAFLYQENRHPDPLVDTSIFSVINFRLASLATGLRMFTIMSLAFLIPLYLTDLKSVGATSIGIIMTAHALTLLTTMRFGGLLADRWSTKGPVIIGVSVQAGGLTLMGLLPHDTPLGWFLLFYFAHGLGAGLSLAALHRMAMSSLPADKSGSAAGLYSSIRFGLGMLGPALAGVIITWSLGRELTTAGAYRIVLFFLAGVCALNSFIGSRMRS
jgi:MFS family permease